MAYSYTRQSTISDGDTITAALFNNEYNQLLNAFAYSSSDAAETGHRHDGSAAQGGSISKIGDLDFLNKIEVDSTNNRWGIYVEVSSSAVEQIRIQDGAIVPVTDNDIDLGTSSLEFKDLYLDGIAYLDTISLNGTTITSTAAEINILDGVTSTASELNILDGVTSTATELNVMDGDTSATSTTLADADRVVVNDNGTMKQVALTDFETYFEAALDTGTNLTTVGALNAGSITSGFGAIDIGSSNLTATGTISLGATSFNDNNITNVGSIQLDSIAGDGDTNTSITFSGSDVITMATGGTTAFTLDASQNAVVGANLTVTGDLTISGDDLVMGTNTSGMLLIADGTNFNPTAIGSLSEISSVANDDVLLAIDTSGGGLKKISRSTLVSGLATSTGISNVAEDSTPQLGGDLDVNGNGLVSTSNGNIALTPNGTGVVRIDGSDGVDISQGAVSIKNGGAQSYVRFYCEASNAHYAQLQAPAHSAFSGNVTITLPATTDTLVGKTTTDTLTNKTLTSPKINEDVAITATATEINVLDGITAVVGELNALDLGSTAVGTAIASKAVILDSNKDYTGLRNFTITGELTAATLDISGDVDIDGTLEADAITVNGTTLAETISDTVGAMVGSNTETGIAVTYDDSDNTLDFVLAAAQTGITSLLATDIKIGEDDQTKVDFETANEIHLYADNVNKVTVDANGMTLNAGALQLKNGSTSAGKIEFFEDSDNGTNKVTLIGPASTADITLTLPSSDGDAGQFMQTDGSGNLSFADSTGMSTSKAFFMGQL